jgi:hypothetical protein
MAIPRSLTDVERMSKRSASPGPRPGSKPELEVLEDRQAPAPVQTAPPGNAAPVAAVVPPSAAAPANTLAPAPVTPAPVAEAVFSTPAALDPLMSQVGRFPEASFQMPTSGAHSDAPPAGDSTALLLPASETPVPSTEESAAPADDSIWYT